MTDLTERAKQRKREKRHGRMHAATEPGGGLALEQNKAFYPTNKIILRTNHSASTEFDPALSPIVNVGLAWK